MVNLKRYKWAQSVDESDAWAPGVTGLPARGGKARSPGRPQIGSGFRCEFSVPDLEVRWIARRAGAPASCIHVSGNSPRLTSMASGKLLAAYLRGEVGVELSNWGCGWPPVQ